MKNVLSKIFIAIVVVIITLLNIISATAFEIVSSSYTVDQYHQGLSGSLANSSSYSIRATTTIQGYSDDASSTSYSADSGVYTSTEPDTEFPNITLNSPITGLNTSSSTINVNVTVNDTTSIQNVSVYGSWGGWHINETNSTGINNADYLFNITIPEGEWVWAVEVCDTAGNCLITENYSIIVDNTNPAITLIGPSNRSTVSIVPVLYTYNVTDNIGLRNCELNIDGIYIANDTSIINGSNLFSRTLTSGDYNWSIDCYDYAGNVDSSDIYDLTVLTSTGGGGGGSYIPREEALNLSKILKDTEAIKSNNLRILMILAAVYFGWLIIAGKDRKKKRIHKDIFLRE